MSTHASDQTGTRILAATLQVLTDYGVRRATIEAVARCAGVSHMTIYRRWTTRDDLIRCAIASERDRVLAEAKQGADAKDSFDDSVITFFTSALWATLTHPLLVRELRSDPEWVLPVITVESGSHLARGCEVLTDVITKAAEAEGLSIHDVDDVAEVVVRVAHSVSLTSREDPEFRTRAGVERYARRTILPIAHSACRRMGSTESVITP